MSFNVRVVNNDQEPIANAGVQISFESGILAGPGDGFSEKEYTDQDGNVYFSGLYESTWPAKVWINDDYYGEYTYSEDGTSITVTKRD